jgi:tRNA A64-2'-O-ribosylphosphate transferase
VAATALLYAEEGEFATTTGLKFTTRRRYVYQLKNDAVIVFFHEEEKEGGVGGLFVEMGDLSLEESDGEGEKVWVAKNRETHLCGEDLYSASWRFGSAMFGGEGGKWWEVRYDVVGPKKEYVSETGYTLA